jgi:hypothetical protein
MPEVHCGSTIRGFAGLLGPWLILLAGIAFSSLTSADDARPQASEPEPLCAKQCASLGFDDGYCARACTVPPARAFPPTHSINWDCATECRAANGPMGDCLRACKRN